MQGKEEPLKLFSSYNISDNRTMTLKKEIQEASYNVFPVNREARSPNSPSLSLTGENNSGLVTAISNVCCMSKNVEFSDKNKYRHTIKEMSTEISWGYKNNLPENAKFLVGVDINDSNGAKKVADLKTFAAMCTFFNENKGGSYYQVIQTINTPVFMYFDIDITETNKEKEEDIILDSFLKAVEGCLKTHYNYTIQFKPGENCQITSSSKPGKCSLHFISYILFPSVLQHKYFTCQLSNYVVSNNIHQLLYYKQNDTTMVHHAVDSSVYTNFRFFRMTYMCKKGSKYILKPIRNSSINSEDYIITYYKEHSREPIFTLDNPIPIFNHTTVPKKQKKVKAPINEDTAKVSIPPNYIKFLDYIENSKEIASLLQVDKVEISYTYSSSSLDNFYILNIKKNNNNTDPVCPFAKRRHSQNNLVFWCNKDMNCIRLKCYDADCRNKCKKFIVFTEEEMHKSYIDNTYIDTLHSMHHNITWSENYENKTMKPYPTKPLVCIRANMGIGKTEKLIQLMYANFTQHTKALVITFSRTLASKYHNDFKEFKFDNYLDIQGVLKSDKIIVCLDSISRVPEISFDYVIIDEALSVFMHLNSSLMNGPNIVCNQLFIQMLLAKNLYMLDACMDHIFMYNIVNFIYEKRVNYANDKLHNKTLIPPPYWINNTYIRPTNRHVKLYYLENYKSSKTISENPIMYSAILKIKDLLSEGKRIVISSSTLSFTEIIYEIVTKEFPDRKTLLYNSKQDNEIIDTSKWTEADVLIYSPSVSAGVSFSILHFDCLVGFMMNNQQTPTVDIVLQQLFRVRALKEGSMYLYVYSQEPTEYLSVSEYGISEYLDNKNKVTYRHYCENITFNTEKDLDLLAYKKETSSYLVLHGIYTMCNRSRTLYVDILKNTLIQDYNIPVTVQNVLTQEKNTEYDDIISKYPENDFPFSKELVICQSDYEKLSIRHFLTTLETVQLRLRNILVNCYGIQESDINEELYNTFVKPKQSYELYNTVLRWYYGVNKSYDIIANESISYLTKLNGEIESNMLLHRNKQLKNLDKLFIAIKLIFTVSKSTTWRSTFKNFQTITVDVDDLVNAYQSVYSDYTVNQKVDFNKLFGISKSVKPYISCKRILEQGLGLSCERQCNQTKRKGFNIIVIKTLDVIQLLFTKYKPSLENSQITTQI